MYIYLDRSFLGIKYRGELEAVQELDILPLLPKKERVRRINSLNLRLREGRSSLRI